MPQSHRDTERRKKQGERKDNVETQRLAENPEKRTGLKTGHYMNQKGRSIVAPSQRER
jgi:hypothetical protein